MSSANQASCGGQHGVKKLVLTALAVILLATAVNAAEFWASRKSNKYHYPDCRWAQRIKSENLIVFNSPAEAIRAGYIPCKVCRPPYGSRSDAESSGGSEHVHFISADAIAMHSDLTMRSSLIYGIK
jgi:methylphosphotriester-DNA--protein-cysteine methyltransferase